MQQHLRLEAFEQGQAADDGWKASKRELLNLLNCFLNNYDDGDLEDDDDHDDGLKDGQDHNDLADGDEQDSGFKGDLCELVNILYCLSINIDEQGHSNRLEDDDDLEDDNHLEDEDYLEDEDDEE